MGELLTLLKYLDPAEGVHYKAGEKEVLEELEEMGITAGELPESLKEAAEENMVTVGSLKE